VFLQHGLAGSADDWVSNEHNLHGDTKNCDEDSNDLEDDDSEREE